MFRSIALTISLILLLGAGAQGQLPVQETGGAAELIPNQYFVRLEEGYARWGWQETSAGPSVSEIANALAAQYGGTVVTVMEHAIQGFVMRIGAWRVWRLSRDLRVRSVTQDVRLPFLVDLGCRDACFAGWEPELQPISVSIPSLQTINCPDANSCEDNWGLDRIDEKELPRDNVYDHSEASGVTVHVYVMDTGIYADHPDFDNVFGSSRVSGGINAHALANGLSNVNDTDDAVCSKHGTSVASVIGGRQFGVAKNVFLHPVKITDTSGHSTVATWIAGLDWISENVELPAVVNISSNGSRPSFPLTEDLLTSLRNVLALNIPVVQSAGNQGEDACDWTLTDPIQGGEENVLVVGGVDMNDVRLNDGSQVSNIGPCVDVWAPAEDIVMAHGYDSGISGQQAVCRDSGTSFAAPHVTGVIALYLQGHREATLDEILEAVTESAWFDVLDQSILDPEPGGPNSNNRLVSSRITREVDLETSFSVSLGNASSPTLLTATVSNLGPDEGEHTSLEVVFENGPPNTNCILPCLFEVRPLGDAQACEVSVTLGGSTTSFLCSLGTIADSGNRSLQWELTPPENGFDLEVSATVSGAFLDPNAINNEDQTTVSPGNSW